MIKKRVYLDYSATTPTDKKVLKAMLPYFSEQFGNPMTIHSYGIMANKALERSRATLASFLKCLPEEVIFTSGATESNNTAIKGVLRAFHNNHQRKPHIITSVFEHNSILNTCKSLAREGMATISYVPISSEGLVSVQDIADKITDDTVLVSIMHVNNEIGTVQPIEEIGKMISNINKKRQLEKSFEILFHTDATQSVNYFNVDVNKLGVHLLSLSGHKIYAPKGVGVLYRKKGIAISGILDGGGQEDGFRSGTHNVPGIVAIGEAIRLLMDKKTKVKNKEIAKLRDYLVKRVLKEIPNSYLNGSKVKRSPNNANFRFDNAEGESLVMSLDMGGVASATGSACSSKSLKPSHVLLSLGLAEENCHGSLRLSLGKYTTKKEIDYAINVLKKELNRLRHISGDVLNNFK